MPPPLTAETPGIPRGGTGLSYFHQENLRERRWCTRSPWRQCLCGKPRTPRVPELVCTCRAADTNACSPCRITAAAAERADDSKLLFVQAVGY